MSFRKKESNKKEKKGGGAKRISASPAFNDTNDPTQSCTRRKKVQC